MSTVTPSPSSSELEPLRVRPTAEAPRPPVTAVTSRMPASNAIDPVVKVALLSEPSTSLPVLPAAGLLTVRLWVLVIAPVRVRVSPVMTLTVESLVSVRPGRLTAPPTRSVPPARVSEPTPSSPELSMTRVPSSRVVPPL